MRSLSRQAKTLHGLNYYFRDEPKSQPAVHELARCKQVVRRDGPGPNVQYVRRAELENATPGAPRIGSGARVPGGGGDDGGDGGDDRRGGGSRRPHELDVQEGAEEGEEGEEADEGEEGEEADEGEEGEEGVEAEGAEEGDGAEAGEAAEAGVAGEKGDLAEEVEEGVQHEVEREFDHGVTVIPSSLPPTVSEPQRPPKVMLALICRR